MHHSAASAALVAKVVLAAAAMIGALYFLFLSVDDALPLAARAECPVVAASLRT
jgi:hypothetical protein